MAETKDLTTLIVEKFDALKGDISKLEKQVNESEQKTKDIFKLDEFKEAIKTQIAELSVIVDGEKKTAQAEYLKNLQTQVNSLESRIAEQAISGKNKVKSVWQQLAEAFQTDGYKNFIAARKAGSKSIEHQIELKAVNITSSIDSIGTGDAILSITQPLEPGVNMAPNNPILFYQLVQKGTVAKDAIAWVERVTVTRNAAMNSENTVFAETAVTWAEKKADVKKITDSMVVTNEALEDIDYAMSEVQELLQYGIPSIRDNEIFNGTGLTTHLSGITTSAKTFAVPTGVDGIATPDEVDVLATGILQCILGNSATDSTNIGFAPTGVVLNPVNLHNIKLIRDEFGKFKYPELWLPNPSIAGVPIYTSTRMTSGAFLIGDFTKAKYFTRRGLTIRMWDQNGNDPIYDRVTFTASERGVLRIKGHDAFAFVYGTFAAAKALLANQA